jgi:cytochrome P450
MTAAAEATSTAKGRTIPGPRGHPILGSIRQIQRDNVQTFMDAWRQYGDIVHFRGPLTINLVVHPDYVERVLRNNVANYPRPEFVTEKLKSIVGEGLVAAEGERWANARRVSQPAFTKDLLDAYGQTMIETTGEMLERWEPYLEAGRQLDIKSEMMHISLANLATAMFHFDLREALDQIEPAVAFALAHTNRRLTSPIDLQKLPLPSSKHFVSVLGGLNQVIYRIIGEHRKAPDGVRDFVNMLLESTDPKTGAPVTDQQARDEVIGFFIAGHETVSSALTWTFYLLSQNPESWRKLKSEVDEVLGGRTPTVDDVPNLKYTEYVLLEAMRLYPPIFVLMRRALDDDVVGGYHVPKGSTVVLCAYVTHRHRDFWDNPEGFDPERFMPERSAHLPRMAYFPFGGGPRKCIGNTFAMIEMPLVVAMIAQRYKVNLVPEQVVFPEPAISLRPRDPVMVTVERAANVVAT